MGMLIDKVQIISFKNPSRLTFKGPLICSSWTSAVDRSGLKVTCEERGNRGEESVTRINNQFPKGLTGPHQSTT